MDNTTLFFAVAACIGSVVFSLRRWPRRRVKASDKSGWRIKGTDFDKVPTDIAQYVITTKPADAYIVVRSRRQREEAVAYQGKSVPPEVAEKLLLEPV